MGKLEEEYKLELTVAYHQCIRKLAEAEMEKRDTGELFNEVLNIQKQIVALDVEMKIDEIREIEKQFIK